MRGRGIFGFLDSRDARVACPLCGHERWDNWDERVHLPRDLNEGDRRKDFEAIPLTCTNCGSVRLQSAHVLDDPRGN